MAWTFEATERGYANLWRTAKLKAGQDNANAETFASKIIAAEARYRAVQNATGVPWFFIGALHMRESSCNFAGVLHNGEHIIGTGRVTTLEPPNRGPFSTWEEAADDALKLKGMHRVQQWSAARMMFQAEVFNGLGYVGKGINAPYVWAGTTHEQRGKYIADHVFDPNADDVQLGVAAVLIRLAEKRADIAAVLYPPETAKPQEPTMPDPATPIPSDQVPGELLAVLNSLRDLPAQISVLNANIALLLRNAGTTPVPPIAPQPAPAPAPAPSAPASTPVLDRPGVGAGALLGVITAVLQSLGAVGAPVGETATATGQLLPIIAAGTSLLGATGTVGTVLNVIGTVAGLFGKLRQQPK